VQVTWHNTGYHDATMSDDIPVHILSLHFWHDGTWHNVVQLMSMSLCTLHAEGSWFGSWTSYYFISEWKPFPIFISLGSRVSLVIVIMSSK